MTAKDLFGVAGIIVMLGLLIYVMALAVHGEMLAEMTAEDEELERQAMEHRKRKALRIANGGR